VDPRVTGPWMKPEIRTHESETIDDDERCRCNEQDFFSRESTSFNTIVFISKFFKTSNQVPGIWAQKNGRKEVGADKRVRTRKRHLGAGTERRMTVGRKYQNDA